MIKYCSILFFILYFCLYSSATSIEFQDRDGNRNPTLRREEDRELEMNVIADFNTYEVNGIELYITYNSDLLKVVDNEDAIEPFDYTDGEFSSGTPIINKVFGDKKGQIGFAAIIMSPNQNLPTGPDNEIAKVKFDVENNVGIKDEDKEEEIKVGNNIKIEKLDKYLYYEGSDSIENDIHWKIVNEGELEEKGISAEHIDIDNQTLMLNSWSDSVWNRDEPIKIELQAYLESTIYFNHSQSDWHRNRYTFYTSAGEQYSFKNYFDTEISMEIGKKTFIVSPIISPEIFEISELELKEGKEFKKELGDYVEENVEWYVKYTSDESKVDLKIDQGALIIDAKQATDTDEPVEVILVANSEGNIDEISIKITVIPAQPPIINKVKIAQEISEIGKDEIKELQVSDYVENLDLSGEIKLTAESTDEEKVSVDNTSPGKIIIEAKQITEHPVEVQFTVEDFKGKDEISVEVAVIHNFAGKIIVNPIIPNYLHIVATAKYEVNVPVLYVELNGEQEIALERKGKIWVGIYKRSVPDETVEIQEIRRKSSYGEGQRGKTVIR